MMKNDVLNTENMLISVNKCTTGFSGQRFALLFEKNHLICSSVSLSIDKIKSVFETEFCLVNYVMHFIMVCVLFGLMC